MDTKTKAWIVGIGAAVLGFALQSNGPLGAMIWPPPPGGAGPAGVQLPLIMVVGIIEAAAFGAGAAFLLFGRPAMQRTGAPSGLATAAWLAITWALVSWVPHTSMHINMVPTDFGRLVLIEYLFHVTLVVSAAITAWWFVKVSRVAAVPAAPQGSARPVAPMAR